MGKNQVYEQFFKLADGLAEDIIDKSEHELLSEAQEDCGDPYAFSVQFDQIFDFASSPGLSSASKVVRLVKKPNTNRTILFMLPAVAAAADVGVTRQGGELVAWSLIPSRRPGSFVLQIELKEPRQEPPSHIVVVSEDGFDHAEHELPVPDDDGKVRVLLDRTNDRDDYFITLLTQPKSIKNFEK